MSELTPSANGVDRHSKARTSARRNAFRVLGVLFMGTALVLFGLAVADFFGSADFGLPSPDDPDFAAWDTTAEGPSRFWMFALGLPFFLLGGIFLQLGFAGATATYMAGEYSPAIQRVSHDLGLRESTGAAGSASGPYCRSCGRRNDADARFCDGCGTSMSA
jgi:hypothetical protein